RPLRPRVDRRQGTRRRSGDRAAPVPSLPEHEAHGPGPGPVDLAVAGRSARRPHGRHAGIGTRRRVLLRSAQSRQGGALMTVPHAFVIDDEEIVRTSLGKLLRAIGIPNTGYASAEAFLASYRGDERGCLIVDVRMPG